MFMGQWRREKKGQVEEREGICGKETEKEEGHTENGVKWSSAEALDTQSQSEEPLGRGLVQNLTACSGLRH